MADQFRTYHRNPLNVALHFITTPLGYLSLLCFSQHLSQSALVSQAIPFVTVFLYLVALAIKVPLWINLINAVILFSLAQISVICVANSFMFLDTPFGAGCLLVVAVFGQDVSHWVTGEVTFQSSYTKSFSETLPMLMTHSFYLLPLCIEAVDLSVLEGLMEWFVTRSFVFKVDLSVDSEKLESIGNLTKDISSYDQFPLDMQKSIEQVAQNPEIIKSFYSLYDEKMYNVLFYKSLITKNTLNSKLIGKNTIDGPWFLFPFVNMYSALISLDHENPINVFYPLHPRTETIEFGQVLIHDFNCEPHWYEYIISFLYCF